MNATTTTTTSKEGDDDDEFYMRQALRVARMALDVGEVPVGCVIVMPSQLLLKSPSSSSSTSTGVVISHGANQVNACRDATRHAEIVAIDRILTGSISTDALRLPQQYLCRRDETTTQMKIWNDAWVNVVSSDDPEHWKNQYGWGSSSGTHRNHHPFVASDLRQCTLYVTCEPCIMCAAALSEVGIQRVVFGCSNDKFGGCGSILHLHQQTPNHSFPITSGVLEQEAISLLQAFYKGENAHAPEEKRRKKKQYSDNNHHAL
jgi:tRNA-specific adenosine deaminase 2